MDSLAHLNGSLSELSESLKKSQHHYPFLTQSRLCQDAQGQVSEEKKQLLIQKGVFPYDKLNNGASYLNATEFPPIDHFYSALTESLPISQLEYEHGKHVFNIFGCATLKDYLKIYNITDVYLLCEVCERYEKSMAEKFGLYAFRYFYKT